MKTLVIVVWLALLTGCGMILVPGKDGAPGSPGDNGSNGGNGADGFDSIISISSTAVTCPNGGVTVTSALDVNRSGIIELNIDQNIALATICNGEAAVGLFSSVTVLDPCGDAPNIVDEVILRLADGTVLASFSTNASGLNTRFAFLSPGTYQTTDGSNCVFTLNSQGQLQ